jgi:Zn-dependent alcohol dehydrogenase
MYTKAAVLYDTRSDLIVESLLLAKPRSGEVLIKMVAAGICHSDVHVISGQAKQELPCVLGHEGAGIVIGLGAGVSRVKIGDHVVLSWLPFCGKCCQCKKDRTHLCQTYQLAISGGTMLDGSCRFTNNVGEVRQLGTLGCWSEHAVVPQECCVAISKKVPFSVAALLGCAVTTGVGAALNRANVKSDDKVVIIGMGGVGLSVLMGAKLRGASTIICIDLSKKVRKLAFSLGCTDFIIADQVIDLAATIKEITGIGADHVFEAVGNRLLQQVAIDYCCPGGQVTYVGLDGPDATIELKTTSITRNEKTITGSIYGSACTDRDFIIYAEKYLEGKLPIDSMIRRDYSIDQINKGIKDLLDGRPGRGIVHFE